MRDDWKPGEDIRKGFPPREEFWREIRDMSSALYRPAAMLRDRPGYEFLPKRTAAIRKHRLVRLKAMIRSGRSDAEIAHSLNIPQCTVQSARLGVFDRVPMFRRSANGRAA